MVENKINPNKQTKLMQPSFPGAYGHLPKPHCENKLFIVYVGHRIPTSSTKMNSSALQNAWQT